MDHHPSAIMDEHRQRTVYTPDTVASEAAKHYQHEASFPESDTDSNSMSETTGGHGMSPRKWNYLHLNRCNQRFLTNAVELDQDDATDELYSISRRLKETATTLDRAVAAMQASLERGMAEDLEEELHGVYEELDVGLGEVYEELDRLHGKERQKELARRRLAQDVKSLQQDVDSLRQRRVAWHRSRHIVSVDGIWFREQLGLVVKTGCFAGEER
ncbi:hypothetical protein B0T16DRAFT_418047 [Cercophora newfieldiana]|uniref:Uncharacterized protein n=1 Tax=Cercophora newfieldiana TaxID=92897 RepID=A0AA39Y276_9PEZI|nr:hypothetical protein B0T16DRAFT_418047 [Cercophora newfieldiana]